MAVIRRAVAVRAASAPARARGSAGRRLAHAGGAHRGPAVGVCPAGGAVVAARRATGDLADTAVAMPRSTVGVAPAGAAIGARGSARGRLTGSGDADRGAAVGVLAARGAVVTVRRAAGRHAGAVVAVVRAAVAVRAAQGVAPGRWGRRPAPGKRRRSRSPTRSRHSSRTGSTIVAGGLLHPGSWHLPFGQCRRAAVRVLPASASVAAGGRARGRV